MQQGGRGDGASRVSLRRADRPRGQEAARCRRVAPCQLRVRAGEPRAAASRPRALQAGRRSRVRQHHRRRRSHSGAVTGAAEKPVCALPGPLWALSLAAATAVFRDRARYGLQNQQRRRRRPLRAQGSHLDGYFAQDHRPDHRQHARGTTADGRTKQGTDEAATIEFVVVSALLRVAAVDVFVGPRSVTTPGATDVVLHRQKVNF